jgi:hypothetical protein
MIEFIVCGSLTVAVVVAAFFAGRRSVWQQAHQLIDANSRILTAFQQGIIEGSVGKSLPSKAAPTATSLGFWPN